MMDYWDTPTFRKRCKQVDKVNDLVEKLNGSMDDPPSAAKMTRRMITLQRYLNGLGLDKKMTKKPSKKCNFNRFKTVDDAIAAFTEEVETLRLSPSAILFAEWLWAPVAKEAK